jgi:hypothetical protein
MMEQFEVQVIGLFPSSFRIKFEVQRPFCQADKFTLPSSCRVNSHLRIFANIDES